MIVLGLTGGIGMGKSTVAKMFAAHGIPCFNADAAVHQLQAPGGRAIPALARAFPGTVNNGVLDRSKLRALVLRDNAAMRRLEAIMHPMVYREEEKFRTAAFRAHRRAVLLDIPLLFEAGGYRRVHRTITVSCPRDVQIARVLKRGLPLAQIEAIIARQMPDAEKRRRAGHVIPTGLSKFHAQRAVRHIIEDLRK
ncbi:dephospho-CoA kinase [Acidocella aquatica]|uniref:Dephospho-CoA kinase n=1 Tax=Acidocella aquatica TaxID=1922313 RepID=A0ABQ6A9A8_9PROT|nr:dephospho-CoA kinase [Acidocella aquatica]GLR66798.1 dephospho-CoA kinase [Acidocella aquatica]